MKAMRTLLIVSVGLLVTPTAVIAQAAPVSGDASLTVDQQIHLGPDSPFFIDGVLLLWTDTDASTGNTALGFAALNNNTTGTGNTATGMGALEYNSEGSRNSAFGAFALQQGSGDEATGDDNTAVGDHALVGNTTGDSNTAVGSSALRNNTEGNFNTAVGIYALYFNSDGHSNTASGYAALAGNTTGGRNTASGHFALDANTTGSGNIALGASSGFSLGRVDPQTGASTYSYNIFIGNEGKVEDQNLIRIGTEFQDNQTPEDPLDDTGQNKTFIAGIATATGGTFSVDVCIDPTTDQLGPCPPPDSSRRFKEEIRDIGRVSEKLMQLRPVRFRFKEKHARGDRSVQYGLIAEEVAEVFPELTIYDDDGAPRSVKYQLLSSLLLNELQKQEQRLAEQNREVVELKAIVSELEDVKTRLARLEISPASPPRVQNRVAELARSSPTQVTPNRE